MKHRQIVFRFLAPADENSAKTVHPTMRTFHDPSARFFKNLALEFLRLFSARANMSSKAKLLNYLAHLIVVVPFVQTETLRFLLGWLRTFHGNTGQRILSQFHVVAVGPAHVQTHGYAVGIDQQAAFGAALGPVGGIFARLFPPRGVPWSCTHPCSARTNRCLSGNRIPTSPPSRSQKRRRLRPILENGRAPWNQDKT